MPGLAMPSVSMLGLADRAHTLAPCEADVRLALVVLRPTQSHWPNAEVRLVHVEVRLADYRAHTGPMRRSGWPYVVVGLTQC